MSLRQGGILPGARGRNAGLDVVRAAAIGLVLLCHSDMYSVWTDATRFGKTVYVMMGILGVELFFVLSGFLIGRIILREVLERPRFTSLLRFYVRRWFRTLPPYFLVVLLLVLLGGRLTWPYLVFMQWVPSYTTEFFPVSWSLAIEEWFYLLVPGALLLSGALFPNRRRPAFFWTGLLIVVVSIAGRWYFAVAAHPALDFTQMRVSPFFRLDSLMIGVLLAGLEKHAPPAYGWIRRHKLIVFLTGALGMTFVGGYQLYRFLAVERPRYPLYSATLFFPLLSVFIALIVASLEPSEALARALSRLRLLGFVEFLSLTSYAAYLIHSTIFDWFRRFGHDLPWLRATALRCAMTLLTLGASYVFYRWFERPVLRLRDRLTLRRSAGQAT